MSLRQELYDDSVPALAECDDKTCWESLFSAVPGPRNNGSFSYMVDRTLYRPREIIQFCTQAFECGHDLKSGLPLRHAAVKEAEREYSSGRAGRTFARDDLEFLCLELITREIPSRETEPWLDSLTPGELVQILWNVGFLLAGVSRDSERNRDGSDVYLGVHQACHLDTASVRHFQVHPMFWTHLGSGTARR
jgi:hypothetical protein